MNALKSPHALKGLNLPKRRSGYMSALVLDLVSVAGQRGPRPSHRVFVMGVPESIHRYLDLSLAAARLARVVLRAGLDGDRLPNNLQTLS